jgi:hypothetical protein
LTLLNGVTVQDAPGSRKPATGREAVQDSFVRNAQRETDVAASCISDGPPFSGDWQVNVKGNTLTLASRATNRAYTVALQADGSGKGVGKDDKNRAFYVTFDRGSGARPFQVTNSITPCTTVFTPKA